MKLNIDCVRDLLIECEDIPYNTHPTIDEIFSAARLTKYSQDDIAYSIKKLYEVGYIKFEIVRVWGHPPIFGNFEDITWSGHEFLNNIRNDNVWNKTKEKISSSVGSASLEIIGAVAGSITTHLLGL